MKKLLILLFICNILYGSKINSNYKFTDIYRTQGLKAVEALINENFKDINYWSYALSDIDLTNGYYESLKYVIVCQKDMKNMDVYESDTKRKLFSSPVFTGQNNGDKQIEGDLKTPVGAYLLNQRITKLDSFYGPLALTTNYPNSYDKALGKTGHGIWIHGLPEDQRRDEYTQGCIALDNKKIKTLDKTINISNSVLIISENSFPKAQKDEIALILSKIHQWKEAWKQSDIDKYLSFYSDEFKRANGQNFKAFKKYKTRIFNKKEKKTINFSNINIIPYPNSQNKKLYKVFMDEIYKTKYYKFEGKKELYVEISNNKFSILSES